MSLYILFGLLNLPFLSINQRAALPDISGNPDLFIYLFYGIFDIL